jgi:hypothetical protein
LIESKIVNDLSVQAQDLNTVDTSIILCNEMSEDNMTELNIDSIGKDSKMVQDQEAEFATIAMIRDIQLMKEAQDEAIASTNEKVENQSRVIEEILVSFCLA